MGCNQSSAVPRPRYLQTDPTNENSNLDTSVNNSNNAANPSGTKVVKDVINKNHQSNRVIKGANLVDETCTKITNPLSCMVSLDAYESDKYTSLKGKIYDCKFKYSYACQRGYYPNAPNKANQDSYLICENVLGTSNCHLFGVFDGHGEFGDQCSYFAADRFPVHLEKQLREHGGIESLEDDPKLVNLYTTAFMSTNESLHKMPTIDDSLSGTTAITVIIKDENLYVGNVGDSRAIVASYDDEGVLKYSPLSHDQTPFRKDERERCKLQGAIVASLDQIEGFEPMHEDWGTESGDQIDVSGDPPRLWDESQERPGCAFTRSIGDAVAEKIGVTAEPELLIWSLSERDKHIIIASDGVFEFLTSQAVVDLLAKFESPFEGAKFVVAEAYRLWLTYDERTDDITIIVITFDEIKKTRVQSVIQLDNIDFGMAGGDQVPNTNGSVTTATDVVVVSPRFPTVVRGDTNSASDQQVAFIDQRPVRRINAGKNTRRIISVDQQFTSMETLRLTPRLAPKSKEELTRIGDMVRNNFLFSKLEESQRVLIFKVMRLREVSGGEVVIKEGDQGDEMYVVDRGHFTVHKKDPAGEVKQVFEYTEPGSTFGELSLMYSVPRAATVRARTPGRLWTIDRMTFRSILLRNVRGGAGLLEFFKAIPLFADVPFPQVQRMCQSLNEQMFEKGEVVCSSDKPPDWILCLVVCGSLKIKTQVASKGFLREANTYIIADEIMTPKGRNDVNTPLHATIEGVSSGRIACLPRAVYNEVMGETGQKVIKNELRTTASVRGRSLERRRSFANDPTRFNLSNVMTSRNHLYMEAPIATVGSFGYIALFQNKTTDQQCTMKVVAKKKAHDASAELGLLTEKQILSALNNLCPCLPTIVSVYQDTKVVILKYADIYQCDLALAIANAAFSEKAKTFYCACIYSAIATLHENAVLHRFINSSSVYITDKGVPKLVDLQYVKRMDGSKSYTICGDPQYFAPEITSNQGYDFAADLWAYGMLVYEIFEGSTLYESIKDETALFKVISAFNGTVRYTDQTSATVREFINDFLNPKPSARRGYGDMKQVRGSKLFKDVLWSTLGEGTGYPVDFVASAEVSSLLNEDALESYSSEIFDQFSQI